MGTDKALLPWPPVAPGSLPTGQTFLSAAIQALDPFSERVIVVVGKNEANLAPVIYANGASLVTNPNPERGQFSSLQVGLREVLNHGRDSAMVTLVDRPPATAATLTHSLFCFCRGARRGVGGRSRIQRKTRAPFSGRERDDRSLSEGSANCERAGDRASKSAPRLLCCRRGCASYDERRHARGVCGIISTDGQITILGSFNNG